MTRITLIRATSECIAARTELNIVLEHYCARKRIAEKQVRKQLRIAEKQVRNTTVFDNYLLKSKSAQTVHDLMSQDVDEEIAAK